MQKVFSLINKIELHDIANERSVVHQKSQSLSFDYVAARQVSKSGCRTLVKRDVTDGSKVVI